MREQPLFSVIIPVFNNWELTAPCLRSLREHSPEHCEVIVVDNGSHDATLSELPLLGEALFGRRFTRIRFEENRNFAPACNAGARAATAPLLFFLNNDTLLCPQWAPPLLDALAGDPSLGGVGPLLLYEDGSIQHMGLAFSLLNVDHLYQGFPADHPVVKPVRRWQALTAAALMTPKACFERANGFYEEYVNGFEDVDYCLRLGRQGKGFACVSASRVVHLESRTPGRKLHEEANARLLYQRCAGLFRPDRHHQALRDGFLPFINDFYGIGLKMKDEDEEALAREAEGQDAAFLFALCRANPFATRVRERLAVLLEQNGYLAESFQLRSEISAILMLAAKAGEALAAAARCGQAGALADAEQDLRELKAARNNVARCRKLLRLALDCGDKLLVSLYEDKLKEASA